jgi:hypothetical protein
MLNQERCCRLPRSKQARSTVTTVLATVTTIIATVLATVTTIIAAVTTIIATVLAAVTTIIAAVLAALTTSNDRVNEQRTRSRLGWKRSIQHFDLVGQGILGQVGITNDHRHFFGDGVCFLYEGNNRVRGILGEAVVTLAPIAHERAGLDVTHNALRAIRKEQGRVSRSVKCYAAVTHRHPMGNLHKQRLDVF